MMVYLIYGIGLLVYLGTPLPAKLILFVINIFVPDSLPYVDEVVMALTILKSLGDS